MSPTTVDITNSSSRKRKLSGNSDVDISEVVVEKRSRLSSAKKSLVNAWNWFSETTKKAFTRDTLVQPISYVSKVWDDLSQSIGQNYEYQGPVLEGPELITSVPTIVPMSNVHLTASSGMPPTNFSTNTTFMNLAPQPSLPPLGASTSLHSGGNSNLNHPLQSLHAMQAGDATILNAEVGQEAAAAVAFAAAHHQQYLHLSSLARSSGVDAGKFGRSTNGFAPVGFSTPIMAVSAAQPRYGNRSVYPFGVGATNVTSFSQTQKSKLIDRIPIKFKKSSLDSTHDKIFIAKSRGKPTTVLRGDCRRSTSGDSPAPSSGFQVPMVFRHLLKRARLKPYTVENSINLKEKLKYEELLRANGMKFNNGASQSSTSSVSSREPRSRSSSIVTIGSQNSQSSHSPPIASLPTNVPWQPVTPVGSILKPIRLDDEEDPQTPDVIVENISTMSTDKKKIEEVVLDGEKEEFTPSHEEAPASPNNNNNDDGEPSKVDDVAKGDGDDNDEPLLVHVVPSPEIVHASTPSPSLSQAFFVEKEITSTKVVDLTDDAETVEAPSSPIFEKKVSVRRVALPSEPDFIKSARQCPYTDKKWLETMKHGTLVDKEKHLESAKEQEAQLVVLKKHQEEQDEELIDRLNKNLKLATRIKPPVEEVFLESSDEESEPEEDEDKDFPPLTEEMDERINDSTNPRPPMEVLASAFKLDITRKDIRTLVGLEWLNDEIINFYMNMLVERAEKAEGAFPKVYTFNTFFYPTLIKDGYGRLKRWTRRVDLFSYDIILVPVHLQMHWCLAVIDLEHKEVRYYDSMGGNNQKCLSALRMYLQEEHKDKKQNAIDLEGWKFECVKDIPQQMNGSDCGMFTCKYAEYVTRRAPINFTQEHMAYFRRRMIFEIVSLKLM